MTFQQVAQSIWRSGFIQDKNKVRQAAKENMRRLIASNISAEIPNEADKQAFMKACGF